MKPTALLVLSLLTVGTKASAENIAANAVNAFAFKGLEVLAKEQGNIAFSPYSAWSALTMTAAGAAGNTLDEMAAVLNLSSGGKSDDIYAAASEWANQIGKSKDVRLDVANRLWASPDFTATEHFERVTQTYYQAGFERLNFAKDKEAARKEINAWIANQTADRIPTLLQPSDVTSDTKLILTNALYFKAGWLREFDPNHTADLPFTKGDGSSVTARSMMSKGSLPYIETDAFQAVRLDYKGKQFSMMVVLPEKGKGKAISAADFEVARKGFKDEPVLLRLPRFHVDERVSMIPLLKKLGMQKAFAHDADFSRMSTDIPLMIGNVVHQSFVKVGEKGTEAAAATAVVMLPRSARPSQETYKQMIVDRPFYFFIIDNQTGGILFVGRVDQPGAS